MDLAVLRRSRIQVSRQSNRAESLSGAQGSPTVPSPYPGLKAVQPCRVLIRGSRQFNPSEWVSRQSNPVESLSGSQGSPTLPSPYLGLKAVQPCRVGLKTVQPCRVLIWVPRQFNPAESSSFQNRSRRVHTSGSIVSGNPQDLCHLASTPWLILMACWCQTFVI